MAVKRSVKKASFDSKALSEELGATVKEGRIAQAKGKYLLTVGKTKLEIPLGGSVSASNLKKLVGSSIPVVISAGKIILIGNPRRPGCYMILCYVPRPDFLREIDDTLRVEVIDKYVSAGAISKTLGSQLKEQTGSVVALG